MALSRLEVDRFLVGGKSQKDAAEYFGVTTRYIRKILATPPAVSSSVPAGVVSDAPAPVDWVRRPGERGLHRVVVAPHNEPEQPVEAEQPALVPTGTTPDPPLAVSPAAHNEIEQKVVEQKVVEHKATSPVRVVRVPIEAARVDVFGWFLAASVGPLPLPAVLLALLLVLMCGML